MSTSMHTSHTARRCLIALVLLCLAPMWNLGAQPSLTFKRVTVNWPTIEVYFTVGCGGKAFTNLTKENFSITENGVDVGDITLWCPDARGIRCAASLGLVLDASGSMMGDAAHEARQIAASLIERLESYDEATLILAGATPLLVAEMTTEKSRLRDGLAASVPLGASALYDGVYAGVVDMINNGVNHCRAVIVISDGEDNASAHTMADIILLANRHRICVFTIGCGPIVQEDSLGWLAKLTGGYYLRNPGFQKTLEVYDYITQLMSGGGGHGNECIITYERGCADGSLRSVAIQLRDVCGGSDEKSKQYRAPFDSGTFGSFDVILPTARIASHGPSTLAIDIDTRGDKIVLPPFELELRLDAALNFRKASTSAGSLLYGVPLQIDDAPGSVVIKSSQPVTVTGSRRLLDVEVGLLAAPTTAGSLLTIEEMRVTSGCYLPKIRNNAFHVHVLPHITISQVLCQGGSAVLEGTAGFPRYLWSTGDTTRVITVATAGLYGLRTVTELGDTLIANPVTLVPQPTATVRISPDPSLSLCTGWVRLSLSGAVDDMSIRWSNGEEGKSIHVRLPGNYWAIATSPFGCVSYSDTVNVTRRISLPSIIASGNLTLCPGDSVLLSLAGNYSNISWQDGVQASTFTVAWEKPISQAERTFTVTAYDSVGCQGTDSIVVRMLDPVMPHITPGPSLWHCDGEVVTLYAGSGFVNYRWSTGDTTEAIEARQSGTYIVTVEDATGCPVADTVFVSSVTSPHPLIAMGSAGLLCGSESVRLDAGPGWESYRWSTGERTEYIVADSAGSYWVEVTGYGGCEGLSDTVHIIREVEPRDFLPTVRGSQPLCPGDTLWLDGPGGMTLWQWSTGRREQSLPVTQAGRYSLTVVTPGGCEVRSGTVVVTMTQSNPPVIVRTNDALGTAPAQSYQWRRNGMPISGAIQQTVVARELGSYTVTIVDEYGCTMTSAPFIVNVLSTGAPFETDDLLLYPDPAQDWLNVIFPAGSRDSRLTLVSLLGQVLARQEEHGESDARTMRIDLSALPAGVYLLQASAGEKWWVRKLIIDN